MKNELINETIGLIVSNLCSVSKIEDFDSVYDTNDYKVTSVRICRLLYDVVSKSDLRLLKGVPYFFTGRIYEPISNELRDEAINRYLRRMRVREIDLLYSRKYFFEEVKRCMKLHNQLSPVFHIKAFRNGVVDMRDGKLRPFSSEYPVIYLNDYDYDPSARCPTWNSFLRQVLPEKESRLILQMYLGLCTLDRGSMVDKIENCLMLYGNGSNGKGVIFDTVKGVFGRSNVSEMPLLSIIKGGDERLRNMAAIDGKVVNFCPEIQVRDMSGYEDAFKSICSGEPQYGRVIGGNVYVVYNIPWMIFSMNNIPSASDCSHGYFRRFLYVVFNHITPDELQNKHLADDLRAEYPGILNWIRRGAKYLKQRRYMFPKSENAEKQKLMVMGKSDVVASWALARGVRFTSHVKNEIFTWVKASTMYNDMLKYAEANDFVWSGTPVSFGRAMSKIGFGNNKRRLSSGAEYKVFGCTEDTFKTPVPVISDINLTFEDTLEVDYDEEDI